MNSPTGSPSVPAANRGAAAISSAGAGIGPSDTPDDDDTPNENRDIFEVPEDIFYIQCSAANSSVSPIATLQSLPAFPQLTNYSNNLRLITCVRVDTPILGSKSNDLTAQIRSETIVSIVDDCRSNFSVS